MQIVVFDFKGFLKEGQGAAQFLRATENAGKVVIGDGAIPISFISVGFSLFQKFKGNRVVF